MNSDKIQYEVVNRSARWRELISDTRYKVHSADFMHKSFLQVFYSMKSDFVESSMSTNLPIASFVTAQARLKLFGEMQRLGERVLYCDTDSIIYVSKENAYEPFLGDFLGEFTNEIDPKESSHIIEFVSAGPKNYAYMLDTGVTHVVIKGFTLCFKASNILKFELMRKLVLEGSTEKVSVEQLKFTREKNTWDIKTQILLKQYRFVYDKRVRLNDNMTTLPYGTCSE